VIRSGDERERLLGLFLLPIPFLPRGLLKLQLALIISFIAMVASALFVKVYPHHVVIRVCVSAVILNSAVGVFPLFGWPAAGLATVLTYVTWRV
jgi:hypothetical protein